MCEGETEMTFQFPGDGRSDTKELRPSLKKKKKNYSADGDGRDPVQFADTIDPSVPFCT
jgi:hypothetical protein